MNKFAFTAALAAVAISAQAQVITEWTFEGDVTTPSTGSGTASLIGGTTATFAGGVNAGTSTSAGRGWNTSGYPAASVGNGTAGARFNVSTAGQTGVTVAFDHRSSNSSSRFFRFEYTTDGTNFVTTGLVNGGVYSATGGDQWNARAFDLRSISAVSNNANFGFRMVAIFDPQGTAYVASNPTSNYATTGTNRFDNVVVAVPEPATMAILGLGLLAARRRRKA